MSQTLFDKIFNAHLVTKVNEKDCLLYIDRHLVHEVTSAQAFDGIRMNGRTVSRPDLTFATADHNISTSNKRAEGHEVEEDSKPSLEAIEANTKEFNIEYLDINDKRQGIVHVFAPEQGLTLPGLTVVCGDSHTSTHGAFGAIAFGIGTSEVEHVLSTQTIIVRKPKNMLIKVNGKLGFGVTAKDLILYIISKIGTNGGTGYAIEFAGDVIKSLSMEGRMTVCNMAIEAGSQFGLIAPDDTTFEYIKNKPRAPKGEVFEKALAYWKTLPSDKNAKYDIIYEFNGADVEPQVTWGTSPEQVIGISASIPKEPLFKNSVSQLTFNRSLEYIGLQAGQKINGVPVDIVFIGSCTNGRIEDLREAAKIIQGRRVSPNVRAMIVPGSGLVKQQAQDEGLDKIFLEAGFEWREPGCSMCLAMNSDKLSPGQRCASTSNRNFEGRQGKNGRTHLMSPAMATAAAISGYITDVRAFAN